MQEQGHFPLANVRIDLCVERMDAQHTGFNPRLDSDESLQVSQADEVPQRLANVVLVPVRSTQPQPSTVRPTPPARARAAPRCQGSALALR
jgi:hypothetical protein